MMKMLSIYPLGKALYRGPGEFDLSSRGVHSTASSLFYPLPTTVSGLLTWIYKSIYGPSRNSNLSRDGCRSDIYWVDEFCQYLWGNFKIYGPIYRIGDGYYIPYDLRRRGFIKVDLSRVNKYPVKRFISGRPGHIEINRLYRDDGFIDVSEEFFDERVGNQLGERKIVVGRLMRGRNRGLYTVKFFRPDRLPEAVLDKPLAAMVEYIYILESPPDIPSGIYRFGGEGSHAYIKVDNLRSEPKSFMEVKESDEYIGLYVLSPILIPTSIDPVKYLQDVYFKGIDNLCIVGESTLLGVGFASKVDNKRRSRRPIYNAIKPGSIIYVKPGEIDVPTICFEGVGIGREIGFGKLLPFKPDTSQKEVEI